MSIKEDVKRMKSAAPYLAASDINDRNRALKLIADCLKDNSERSLPQTSLILTQQKQTVSHRQS